MNEICTVSSRPKAQRISCITVLGLLQRLVHTQKVRLGSAWMHAVSVGHKRVLHRLRLQATMSDDSAVLLAKRPAELMPVMGRRHHS